MKKSLLNMTSRKNLLFIFFTLKDDLYVLASSYFYSIPTWDKHMTAVTESPINLIWRQFRASCKVVRISHPIPYIVNLSVWKINQIWLAHQQRPVKVGSKLVVEASNYGGQSSAELSHMADIPVILELSFAHCAKRVSHVSIFKEWFDRMTLHDRWKQLAEKINLYHQNHDPHPQNMKSHKVKIKLLFDWNCLLPHGNTLHW